MKPCYKFLILLSCFLSYGLSAQPKLMADDETDSRKGKIWLSGNSRSLDENLVAGVGYFLTEDLLIGNQIESLNISGGIYQLSLSPFVRYYAGEIGNGWLPYVQVGANWIFDGSLKSFNSYGARVGVEKNLQTSTLLNINADYTNTQFFDSNDWSLSARLNTILGGPAGKNAAMGYFQKGTFLLSGQLFGAALSNSRLADGFFANITPHGHYFLSERLAIEGSLGLIFNDYNQEIGLVERELTQKEFNLVVGLRYYITSKSLFNVFSEADFIYDYRRTTVNSDSDNQSKVFASYELGNSLFINRSTSFDLGVNVTQGFEDGARGLEWGLSGRLNFWLR
jgi:hypothetical protein